MQDMQNQLNLAVVQMLQQQIRKTCFGKCFTSNSFPAELHKGDQICLAKCMDRMIESHSIVVKASTEMAENLASQTSQ